MPAADELFRSTAGNGTLLQNPRAEEPERERGTPGRIGGSAARPSQAQPQSGPPGQAIVPAQAQPVDGSTVAARAAAEAMGSGSAGPAAPTAPPAPATPRAKRGSAPRRPSGRERHDEKITVYVSPDELLGLEHARITLRGEYGVAVDRGRIVREAIAALLADLDARGPDSILVKRLSAGG
jgi:hypothetical protein